MSVDLIIYGVVAAGLVVWLRNLLGTRHGEERQRPNPFTTLPEQVSDTVIEGSFSETKSGADLLQLQIKEISENPSKGLFIAKSPLVLEGLQKIVDQDRNFAVKDFMRKAQDAFVIIVEAFAAGDKESLRDLLSPSVFAAFDTAITERNRRGEVMTLEIRAFDKTEILAAKVENKNAFVTLRFSALEISTTRDVAGKLLSGNPEKPSEMIDIWTFTRPISSSDPRWLLCETRPDDAKDNDIIPNIH